MSGKRDATSVRLLRDTLARVIRATDALEDGESDLVYAILDDLAADLWKAIEEREAA